MYIFEAVTSHTLVVRSGTIYKILLSMTWTLLLLSEPRYRSSAMLECSKRSDQPSRINRRPTRTRDISRRGRRPDNIKPRLRRAAVLTYRDGLTGYLHFDFELYLLPCFELSKIRSGVSFLGERRILTLGIFPVFPSNREREGRPCACFCAFKGASEGRGSKRMIIAGNVGVCRSCSSSYRLAKEGGDMNGF